MIEQIKDFAIITAILALPCAGIAVSLHDHFKDDPKKKLAEAAASLWKTTKILFWIAIGVPTAVIALLLCIIWPPMLAVIVFGIFFTILWLARNVPAQPGSACRCDTVTPFIVGVIIGESLHDR